MSRHREAVRTARSVVVKVGTTALTTPSGVFDAGRLATLADAIEGRMKAGSDVVIVSSGAVAAGIEPLKLTKRPADLATKQAAASVGQVALVNSWSTAFARYNRTVGQVLLTAHDISMRVQHTNAQRTLDRLRALHAVAIVNENDTVATNEIRFGDNDRLSALVAHLVGADALVLLSDIDGLYDGDPRRKGNSNARFIPEVGAPSDLDGVVAGRGSHLGTGGMASKLSSALLASDAGVPVLLAAAADAATALADASVGTVFAPRPERMSARKFWVRYAAEVSGALTLDDGAVRAIVRQRRSLLPAGITAVSGRFYGGDVVELRAQDATMVARGVVAYDALGIGQHVGPVDAGSARRNAPAGRARRRPGRRLSAEFVDLRLNRRQHRLDLLGPLVGVLHHVVLGGTDRDAVRMRGRLDAPADGRIGQDDRGEHPGGELARAQQPVIVHLGGYPDF